MKLKGGVRCSISVLACRLTSLPLVISRAWIESLAAGKSIANAREWASWVGYFPQVGSLLVR